MIGLIGPTNHISNIYYLIMTFVAKHYNNLPRSEICYICTTAEVVGVQTNQYRQR
jgi:hypothetical protein